MSALSASLVIDGDVTTGTHEHDAWEGHVIVDVREGDRTAITLYIAEDKARELVEQLTAALAVNAGAS